MSFAPFKPDIRSVFKWVDSRFRRAPENRASTPPPEVLSELIDSLYGPIASLLVGAGCGVFVGIFAALQAGSEILFAISMVMAIIATYRLILAFRYRSRNAKTLTAGELRYWEQSYALGAIAYAGAFGCLSFAVLAWTNDASCQLLVGSTLLGYSAGVTARNSGRLRIALGQLTLALGAMAVGAALHGGGAYYALAVMTLLYLVAAVEISSYLSARNLRLLLLNRENNTLAITLAEQHRRLDVALNNMARGICMFDSSGHLVVSNDILDQIYGLPPRSLTPGMTLEDIVAKMIEAGAHSDANIADVLNLYRDNLSQNQTMSHNIKLCNGRMISWSQRALSEGGAVVVFEDVTEREQAEARAQYLSTHDGLTGLPNRFMFERLLANAVKAGKRYGATFAVMFLDLDSFKTVNDSLGHSAGDSLLKEVAARLKACLPDTDIVARLGGDEFVVLLYDVATPQQVDAIARKIIASLAPPASIQGVPCSAGASIGIAMFPLDSSDETGLMKQADAAMYRAKEGGKGCYQFFSAGVQTEAMERLKLETEIRQALENDELVLYYQPRLDVSSGAITCAEALLRWRHPTRGLLSPDRFISLAEETGLIVPIGKWVLEAACADYSALRAQGLPEFRIAVNLSPQQFAYDSLVPDIETAIEKSGMPPTSLELEITESLVIQNVQNTESLLHALRAKGIRVAIDDFGVGYSSLARLKSLPIDVIKIDRAFVQGIVSDPKDQAIAYAIIALGKSLGLTVVAEGVELAEQEAFLRDCGCDDIQGYLFAKPMPSDDLMRFVRAHEMERPYASLHKVAQAENSPADNLLAVSG